MFGWEWKSGGMEKVSLYKFTHVPLLKNDAKLKQKSEKQPQKKKKKIQSPKFIKKLKLCLGKKITSRQKKKKIGMRTKETLINSVHVRYKT